jgi:hypothetical protein
MQKVVSATSTMFWPRNFKLLKSCQVHHHINTKQFASLYYITEVKEQTKVAPYKIVHFHMISLLVLVIFTFFVIIY